MVDAYDESLDNVRCNDEQPGQRRKWECSAMRAAVLALADFYDGTNRAVAAHLRQLATDDGHDSK